MFWLLFLKVGLAAPQIGVGLRIIVMESSEQLKEKYPAAVYKARGCEILPMTVSDSIELDFNFNMYTDSAKLSVLKIS